MEVKAEQYIQDFAMLCKISMVYANIRWNFFVNAHLRNYIQILWQWYIFVWFRWLYLKDIEHTIINSGVKTKVTYYNKLYTFLFAQTNIQTDWQTNFKSVTTKLRMVLEWKAYI